ncbi:hypothetical protein RhiirA1_471930 [Rhizophagus irregularis]|uniref:Serine-threonine/tyrosine-protein kinase catalytic domain-containing protein n=1 Tax=Rhizophagus irregularis TaxID=588596 RepID=A0A2N0R3D4_9GLOM|nr:hypothetical protein RhiirA1_471930 [Rhizophagus irregularis]
MLQTMWKSLYQRTDRNVVEYYKLCSDCSFFGDTQIKAMNTIDYIEWIPYGELVDMIRIDEDCQKYCVNCFIYYVGCRYCLTTNMIFGLTSQSQCKTCISLILNDNEGFLTYNVMYYDNKLPEVANIWIPYFQFIDVKEMIKGGYSIIHKANWFSMIMWELTTGCKPFAIIFNWLRNT